MKKLHLLKRTLLLLALIVGCVNYGWADSYTTTFNSGIATTPYSGENLDYWNISKSGTTGYEAARGIQFQNSATGTFETKTSYDNVSEVVVDVAKSSKGAGTVKIYVNDVLKKTISSFSTTKTSETLTLSPSVSGKVKVIVSATASSLYIKNIKVTYTPAVKKNTTLTLSPASLSFSYGEDAKTLTATVTPEGESALASPTISWSSDNLAVATVENGVVTPVGEGSCYITATYAGDNDYNGSNNSATVTVSDTRTAVVSAIASIWNQKTLYVGRSTYFTPSVTLADGLTDSDVEYSYVSADPTVFRINDDGTFTVLKTGTNIDITVTATPIAAQSATYKPVSATFQHTAAYRYTGLTLPEEGEFNGSKEIEITLSNTPSGPIYYTTNGNDPLEDEENRIAYSEPFTITSTTTVKARVIDGDGQCSTLQSATYTKVPANKDAISLAAGQSLSFASFSNAGAYTDHVTDNVKTVYFLSSDGDNYKFTGVDFGSYNNNSYRLQLKSTTGTMTSGAITSTNGFKMTLNVYNSGSASVKVYVGETEKTAVDGAYYFSSGDAVTIKRNTGTPQISNITFTALKPTRSVTFEDGDQVITVDGETITKTATISPAGTATYTSSNTAVATVNATTGEVTAVKGGSAVITATVAADEDYEKSTGSYTVTVNKAATTLAFANDEKTVELVDGTATFTATATPADGTRVITYSSEDITVNISTGVVTLTETGDFVIKANAAATDKYLAPEEASYTLHVVDNRQPVVSVASVALNLEGVADLSNVAKDALGTIGATYTKTVGFSGTETVTFVSSNPAVLEIADGNFLALKGGTSTVTVTITSGGDKMFTTVEKEFEVTVINSSKTATEITIEPSTTPINTTYGDDAIELLYDVTAGYEGEVTYALSNSNIADVVMSAGTATITPKAAGTTTLTFSAVETANYSAAEDVVLTINVAEPTSKTTSGTVDGTVEDLDFSEYLVPESWTVTTTNVNEYQAWTNNKSNDFISANGYKSGTRYAGTYDYVTEEYDLTRYSSANLEFEHAGQYFNSSISDGVKLFAEVDGEEQELTINTYFDGTSYNKYVKNTTSINALCGKMAKIIFRYISDGTSTNTGRWDIKSFKISGQTLPSEAVTVASSGFSTYCYQYPLDLDLLDEDVKAYIVTSVEGTNVTFQRITGTIKGGVPFILYGTAGEHTLYTAASSTNVPEGNMLVGTLAPKYITATNGDYTNFGLKNGKFVKATNGVIGANKAYLPILTSSIGSGAHEFNINFDEGETTAISEVRGLKSDVRGEFYNLNGQRVATPVKGNIYIVNGKKVMFK